MHETQPTLFAMPEDAPAACPAEPASASPRLRLAERFQVAIHCESLDQRLAEDHLARVVWNFVASLDLTPLLAQIKAVEGQTGRDATDPRILLSVWLLAFAEGHGSARAVDRLCQRDRAYEWLCGGVTLNYHLLADFRVHHRHYINQLFTDSLTAFLHEGLLELKRTAQDGLRVRASAGKASFRRQATLEKCLVEAQKHVAQLERDFDNGSAAATLAEQKAQKRAAHERVERVQNALRQVEELACQREARQKGSGPGARASTTDTGSGLVVGVDVTNQGTDAGLMDPMLEQIEERTDRVPDEHLTDGGFATVGDINKVAARGTTVYTPVKEVAQKQAKGIDPYEPLQTDSAAVAAWRKRMGTDEAQTIYKLRAQTAEWTNAQARNRNFYQVRVRGRDKVYLIALWHALVHNLLTAMRLRAKRAEAPAPAATDR
jgi:transposase